MTCMKNVVTNSGADGAPLQPTEKTLVSVVIPAYNSAQTIMRAVESVRRQSYAPYEVIVVDDGSTDGTADIVKAFPDVTYYYQENSGPAAARNLGVAKASGRLVAFLDADDRWQPEKLQKCVNALLGSEKARVVISDFALYDDEHERELRSPKPLRFYSPLTILLSSTPSWRRPSLKRNKAYTPKRNQPRVRRRRSWHIVGGL